MHLHRYNSRGRQCGLIDQLRLDAERRTARGPEGPHLRFWDFNLSSRAQQPPTHSPQSVTRGPEAGIVWVGCFVRPQGSRVGPVEHSPGAMVSRAGGIQSRCLEMNKAVMNAPIILNIEIRARGWLAVSPLIWLRGQATCKLDHSMRADQPQADIVTSGVPLGKVIN
jgi:hypothetical protein